MSACLRCAPGLPLGVNSPCDPDESDTGVRGQPQVPLAPGGTIRLVDFDDLDVLLPQEARQGGSVGSGALHSGTVQDAEGAGPGEELAVSGSGGRELLVSQQCAERGDHCGDVHVLVGVDPEDHVLRGLWCPLCGQGRLGHAGDGHAAPSSAGADGRRRAEGRSEL